MSQQTWIKVAKKHERSFTYGDQDTIKDKISKLNLQNQLHWMTQEPINQEEQVSSLINKNKRKQLQLFQGGTVQQKISSTSRTYRNTPTRGDITNRTDRSQRTEKTPRQLSRDLQKVQRIIQIDNDIIKSQIKNLNFQYKNKRQSLQYQNKILRQRTERLQSIGAQNKRQISIFKQMFQQTITFLKDKLNQQDEINKIYSKQINLLKTENRLNSTVGDILNKSKIRKDSTSTNRSCQEKQKYIDIIRQLQAELIEKNKIIENYESQQGKSKLPSIQDHFKNKQRTFSFSKQLQPRQNIINNCEQIQSLSRILLQKQIKEQSALVQLNQKLSSVILDFERILLKKTDRHSISSQKRTMDFLDKSEVFSAEISQNTFQIKLKELTQR